MRRLLPVLMGLALSMGTVGVSSAQDTYKDKEKTKVENNGDVKIKDKTRDDLGKHKVKTKVKHNGNEIKVKEKDK